MMRLGNVTRSWNLVAASVDTLLAGIAFVGLAGPSSSGAEPAGIRPPTPGPSAVTGASATWPKEVQEVSIHSTADGSIQPALFWEAPGQEERPLLVALHSWSGDHRQTTGIAYATRCLERRWHFLHPNFRGVNQCPAATCSDMAVTDILDAVEFARHHARVDSRRIYLVGVSGGGMAALQVLAKAPALWAGVSAWAPISDLAAWHAETKARSLYYTRQIEASCGGPPGASAAVDFQYWNRSPIHFLARASGVPLDLNAGIRDGHEGSVPISHSLHAFNVLAHPSDRLPESAIADVVKDAQVPQSLRSEHRDPFYGANTVLFRRESGSVRITLFDGGHEIVHDAALAWLEKQGRQSGQTERPE
jgi:pimeloyl-ACP methyl ester carboxylesterase